jgi:hypothetical protein
MGTVDRGGANHSSAQIRLIKAVAKVNPRTIVVINTGNPLGMS